MVELTDLDGVGPARSDSLADAGYSTVEDVANADADTLAEDADVPEDTALEFVVQAQNLVDDTEASEDDAEESDEEDGPSPADLAEAAEEATDDDENESEDEAEVAAAESYEVEIIFENDTQYDAYFTALLHGYERRANSHQPSAEALEHALDEMRYEQDSVTHDFTEFELNEVHAQVKQQATDYKGNNMIEYMDAANAVLDQINEVRSEKLFN